MLRGDAARSQTSRSLRPWPGVSLLVGAIVIVVTIAVVGLINVPIGALAGDDPPSSPGPPITR